MLSRGDLAQNSRKESDESRKSNSIGRFQAKPDNHNIFNVGNGGVGQPDVKMVTRQALNNQKYGHLENDNFSHPNQRHVRSKEHDIFNTQADRGSGSESRMISRKELNSQKYGEGDSRNRSNSTKSNFSRHGCRPRDQDMISDALSVTGGGRMPISDELDNDRHSYKPNGNYSNSSASKSNFNRHGSRPRDQNPIGDHGGSLEDARSPNRDKLGYNKPQEFNHKDYDLGRRNSRHSSRPRDQNPIGDHGGSLEDARTPNRDKLGSNKPLEFNHKDYDLGRRNSRHISRPRDQNPIGDHGGSFEDAPIPNKPDPMSNKQSPIKHRDYNLGKRNSRAGCRPQDNNPISQRDSFDPHPPNSRKDLNSQKQPYFQDIPSVRRSSRYGFRPQDNNPICRLDSETYSRNDTNENYRINKVQGKHNRANRVDLSRRESAGGYRRRSSDMTLGSEQSVYSQYQNPDERFPGKQEISSQMVNKAAKSRYSFRPKEENRVVGDGSANKIPNRGEVSEGKGVGTSQRKFRINRSKDQYRDSYDYKPKEKSETPPWEATKQRTFPVSDARESIQLESRHSPDGFDEQNSILVSQENVDISPKLDQAQNFSEQQKFESMEILPKPNPPSVKFDFHGPSNVAPTNAHQMHTAIQEEKDFWRESDETLALKSSFDKMTPHESEAPKVDYGLEDMDNIFSQILTFHKDKLGPGFKAETNQ